MASKGNKRLNEGIPQVKDAFVVIVATEWNAHIVNKLKAGAVKVFKEADIAYKVLTVPGAVEIPFVIKNFAQHNSVDAFVALGTVIRGDTPHFDYVCKLITDGILQLNLQLNVPTIFGVLTVNDEKQALERVGGTRGHKGEEAAVTAIKMIALNRSIKK